MAIVKKYKGYDIPEGVIRVWKDVFYKFDAGILVCQAVDSDSDCWKESNFNSLDDLDRNNDVLVIEPEVYMPKVGGWCEVESDIRNVWKKAMYVGVDSIGSHVFDVEKRHLWRIDSIDVLVRPIKTEREKFIEEATALNNNLGLHPTLEDMLAALYDAGARFESAVITKEVK